MPERSYITGIAIALILLTSAGPLSGQSTSAAGAAVTGGDGVRSPSDYFGFPVGADFKLARWDSITAYFNHLAQSPIVQVDTLGQTTQGRPFIVVTASAPQNMARLDEIRANQAKLADPRRLGEAELESLLRTQPAVVLIAHNIHSTEIASSQGAMQLAHLLATDDELLEALRSVVVLLIPSVNPDGQVMVVDWYRRTLGTPFEGSRMPWLYHYYAGHDNNRDWFMLTQAETRLVTDLLYGDWFPEVVYDVHQMGNRGARFFVPPFDDPVNPNLDPLLVRMISLFGLQMSAQLEAAGKSGVVNSLTFDLWWHGGNRSVPTRHNMIGILSEAASARIASPIFQEPDQLTSQPPHGVSHPNTWPGGWWRMSDIMDYQMIAARSLIGLAARQRRALISNYVEVGRRAIAAGTEDPPFAFVLPAQQRDPGSAARMLEILRLGGIEIDRATAGFDADGMQFQRGSYVVRMAQPYRVHAKDLLERQHYPDRRLYPEGPPDQPYDVSGWTLPLQMGVDVVEVSGSFEAALTQERGSIRPPPGTVSATGGALLLDNTTNAANLAIHRALASGARVELLSEARQINGRTWPVGSVMLEGGSVRGILEELATSEGLSAETAASELVGNRLSPLRVGLYQSWSASMDEGWTRWVFDNWDVPYSSLHNTEIRAGGLRARYDVIILPDLSAKQIVDGRKLGTVPAEYEGGLGDAGVAAIRDFVRSGGTLICLGNSSDFAIEALRLAVENVKPDTAAQRSGSAFYAPGSILLTTMDGHHPVGYGMPRETAVYYSDGPIFKVRERAKAVTVVASYPETGQLLSGYAIHPEFLAGKAALVEARVGDGRAILFGFRPQHRGQPQETFKVLFNAIYRGAARGPEPVRATLE